jgi:nitroreductase
LRAPVIVVVAARIEPEHPKIPAIEQIGSAAAAAQNMLLAAHALGFAAKWATGRQAYDDAVKAGLGLRESDLIVGFLYLGSYAVDHPPTPRAGLDDVVRDWPEAGEG